MFLLPYAFSTEFDFLKVLDILVFFSKIFDKMLAFLNLKSFRNTFLQLGLRKQFKTF